MPVHRLPWLGPLVSAAALPRSLALPAGNASQGGACRPESAAGPLAVPIGATDRRLPLEASILRTLANSVPHHIYAKDAQGRFIFANSAVARGMGVASPDDLLGKTDFDFYARASAQQYHDAEQGIILRGRPILDLEEYLTYELTGRKAWILTTKVPLRNEANQIVGIVGINYDITERKAMEQALKSATRAAEQARDDLLESENRYRHLVMELPDGLLVAREGEVIFANPAAIRLYAAKSMEDLVGRSLDSLAGASEGSGHSTRPADLDDAAVAIDSDEVALRLDGSRTFVATSRLPIKLSGLPAVQMVVRDVSLRRTLESSLNHQAKHDALTGLPNRVLLTDQMERAIRHGRHFHVCLIDLDRFKGINDSLGHAAGDRLLGIVAERIRACLRVTDSAARLGGDEFIVLLRQCPSERDVMEITSRLLHSIAQPIRLSDEQVVTMTCSAGCSRFPEDASTTDALLKYADAAMYRAKALGRSQIHFHNVELRRRIDERAHIEIELQRAIERRQLSLHYQPQIGIDDERVVAVEALLRWRHPELGDIAPDRFIPIAEEIGLIVQIGTWVIETACAQMVEWQRQGVAPARMAVNVSAKQFTQDDLVATIRKVLDKTGMQASCLDVELTESASMDDPERSILLMRELKSLGVHLSIDDFGTGYSNMGYLRRFPVDQLKLDGSFISDVDTDDGALAIVEAIVSLSHRLGLGVVAERVETEQQLARLRSCGCDFVQGYLFSKPLPAVDCTRLLGGKNS